MSEPSTTRKFLLGGRPVLVEVASEEMRLRAYLYPIAGSGEVQPATLYADVPASAYGDPWQWVEQSWLAALPLPPSPPPPGGRPGDGPA